jgi:hypothetical protein
MAAPRAAPLLTPSGVREGHPWSRPLIRAIPGHAPLPGGSAQQRARPGSHREAQPRRGPSRTSSGEDGTIDTKHKGL